MEKLRVYLRDMLHMSEQIPSAFNEASDESVEDFAREEEEEEEGEEEGEEEDEEDELGDSVSEMMMQDSPTISNYRFQLERNDSVSDLLLTSTQHASRLLRMLLRMFLHPGCF